MKKLLLATLLIGMMGGCIDKPTSNKEDQLTDTVTKQNQIVKDTVLNGKYYYLAVKEYTYQGCQYIRVGYRAEVWGAHKGNCSNPIHKESNK